MCTCTDALVPLVSIKCICLLFYSHTHLPRAQSPNAMLKRQVLCFHRGVGVAEDSGLFLNEKVRQEVACS